MMQGCAVKKMDRGFVLILLFTLLTFPAHGEGVSLSVAHAEADRTVEIEMLCGGQPYDSFEQAEDGLGVTILKNMAKKIDCRREDDQTRVSIAL